MVAYSDMPQVNVLYAEQENISKGLALLDASGTVTSFTISPAPNPDAPSFSMPIQIATVAPQQSLMDQARTAMTTRYNDITSQLAALGVTGSPPA
jgi:hypothetical protein